MKISLITIPDNYECETIYQELIRQTENSDKAEFNLPDGRVLKLIITDMVTTPTCYETETNIIHVNRWMRVNPDLYGYVLLHEVGHALIGAKKPFSQIWHDIENVMIRATKTQLAFIKSAPKKNPYMLIYGLGMSCAGIIITPVLLSKLIIGKVKARKGAET